MMSKSVKLGAISSILFGVCATSAFAQVVNNEAYLTDARSVVARSGTGLCWRTAEWTPAKAIAECDPDLVKVAEAAPAPVPAPVPAPAPKCDFGSSLAADTTFAFGKAGLSDAAKAQLDTIASDAMGRCGKVDAVRVVGHTDRIGSTKGNQKLSEKRANEVKAYLESKGLKAGKIEAVGMGESQPLAGVVCSAKQSKAKLIKCLAPNRRVAVEVTGSAK